jgi:ABC-2 type transport system ATP-binding protein
MTGPSASALLALENVNRGYGSRSVLDGASLTLHAGRTAWLRGQNGTGKTTLLRVAAGLLEPQGGTVRLAGYDPRRDRREFQRRLGYVPAGGGGLYARLTVEQHLRFWLGIALVSHDQHSERLGWAYETLSLGELASRRVDRLSTGQRQRVRLALGFLHEPMVVLLDEPLVSLDDAGGESLERAVEQVKARGGSVLWCAPTRVAATLEVDDCFVLEAGRVAPEPEPLIAGAGRVSG